MGVAFFALLVAENTLFGEDAALFTLFVVVFTLSEICSSSSFYLVCGSFALSSHKNVRVFFKFYNLDRYQAVQVQKYHTT